MTKQISREIQQPNSPTTQENSIKTSEPNSVLLQVNPMNRLLRLSIGVAALQDIEVTY